MRKTRALLAAAVTLSSAAATNRCTCASQESRGSAVPATGGEPLFRSPEAVRVTALERLLAWVPEGCEVEIYSANCNRMNAVRAEEFLVAWEEVRRDGSEPVVWKHVLGHTATRLGPYMGNIAILGMRDGDNRLARVEDDTAYYFGPISERAVAFRSLIACERNQRAAR